MGQKKNVRGQAAFEHRNRQRCREWANTEREVQVLLEETERDPYTDEEDEPDRFA